MIYQSYVHYFCRLVKMFRQPIILCTRSHTAGRMVVTKCHGNGPFQQCFPQYTTDIYRCRDQASGTYLYTVNYFGSLIQQQYPAFLCRQITHQRIKILINITGAENDLTFFSFFLLSALSQFGSRQNGDSFGRTYSFIVTQFIYGSFALFIQTIMIITQHFTH